MSCENEVTTARTLAVLTTGVPRASSFKDALAEVRKQGRPSTLDIADAALESLGGATALGKMMAEDLKTLRGDNLADDLKMFHDPDWKVIKGLYDVLVKLSAERDAMVGGSGDPLEGVSEEDLMAIAGHAATLQIEIDPEFRKRLLIHIVQIDPEAVIEAAGEALDIIDTRPKVEVVDEPA